MLLSISGEGHLTNVILTDGQVQYLQKLLVERTHDPDDIPTLAGEARWAIEQAREAWQAEGQQDGPR